MWLEWRDVAFEATTCGAITIDDAVYLYKENGDWICVNGSGEAIAKALLCGVQSVQACVEDLLRAYDVEPSVALADAERLFVQLWMLDYIRPTTIDIDVSLRIRGV